MWQQVSDRVSQHPLLAERPVVRQFMKFAMVGVVNTLISFLVYFLTTRALSFPPLVANAVAFAVAVTTSYFLNKRWTFRDKRRVSTHQYGLFFAISIVGLGLSELIIAVLHHLLGWNDLIAFFSAVIVIMFWNFGANRFWTFRPVGS